MAGRVSRLQEVPGQAGVLRGPRVLLGLEPMPTLRPQGSGNLLCPGVRLRLRAVVGTLFSPANPISLIEPFLILSTAATWARPLSLPTWVTRGASSLGSRLPPSVPSTPSSHRDAVKPKSHPVPPLLKTLPWLPLTGSQDQSTHQNITASCDSSLAPLPATSALLTLL